MRTFTVSPILTSSVLLLIVPDVVLGIITGDIDISSNVPIALSLGVVKLCNAFYNRILCWITDFSNTT